ncbi:SAM-dependent methyltransferase [Rugosimonospora acidiphila]|uniref:SAM-dependent methyltransferase n=1 Tax=Rugosimonospora acidiphila TaxID=556531 RepID=A0ABP9SK57_9ACTN
MTNGGINRGTDIYIVGLGIKTIQHITREAEQAMRCCTKVFFVDDGFGVEEFISSLGAEARPMMHLYQEGGERRRTYVAMAASVLDAALDEGPVCFASYGHPQVYVHPTRLIQEGAALLGLTVRVLPGISALDTIITDVGLDPGPQGLQMYEATDVLARARPLQPDVPCLLWQVSAVETGLYSRQRGNAARFARLQRHLLTIYPPEHQVTMVLSANYQLLDAWQESFPLGELAERLAEGLQAGTLYIPAVRPRPITDIGLLREANDPEHLRRITAG